MILNLQQLKEFSYINNLHRINVIRLITNEDISQDYGALLWKGQIPFTEEMDKKFQLLRKNKKYFQTMVEKIECIRDLEILIKKCIYEDVAVTREILQYGIKYEKGKIDTVATRNIYRAKELLKILRKKYSEGIFSVKLKTLITEGEVILVKNAKDCCNRQEGVYIKYKDIDYIFYIAAQRYKLFEHLFNRNNKNKLKVHAITQEDRAIISTIEVLE